MVTGRSIDLPFASTAAWPATCSRGTCCCIELAEHGISLGRTPACLRRAICVIECSPACHINALFCAGATATDRRRHC